MPPAWGCACSSAARRASPTGRTSPPPASSASPRARSSRRTSPSCRHSRPRAAVPCRDDLGIFDAAGLAASVADDRARLEQVIAQARAADPAVRRIKSVSLRSGQRETIVRSSTGTDDRVPPQLVLPGRRRRRRARRPVRTRLGVGCRDLARRPAVGGHRRGGRSQGGVAARRRPPRGGTTAGDPRPRGGGGVPVAARHHALGGRGAQGPLALGREGRVPPSPPGRSPSSTTRRCPARSGRLPATTKASRRGARC